MNDPEPGEEETARAAADAILAGRWDAWLVLLSSAIKTRRGEINRERGR